MVHYSKNDIKCTLPHITTSAIMNNIKGADSVEAMRQRYIENKIPKSLIIEGKTAPQSARTEAELWQKLYIYLYGDEATDERNRVMDWFDKWIDYRTDEGIIVSNTIDIYRQHYNRFIRKGGEGGDRIAQIFDRASDILSRLKRINPKGIYILTNQSGNPIKTDKFNKHLKKYFIYNV